MYNICNYYINIGEGATSSTQPKAPRIKERSALKPQGEVHTKTEVVTLKVGNDNETEIVLYDNWYFVKVQDVNH